MTEPIKELVQDELNKLRVMHELRMGSIIDNDSASFEQLERNGELRLYRLTLKTIAHGLGWLNDNHDGVEYIKELERWRAALVADSHQMREAGEKQAHQDFSRGIMEAYKKVNMWYTSRKSIGRAIHDRT